jgi:presenilin-like A22 family membrane protease
MVWQTIVPIVLEQQLYFKFLHLLIYNMKLLTALTGGLAGACALTLLHQKLKKTDPKAPHVDELGMEAVTKGLTAADVQLPKGEKLYNLTLAGDIIANTMYYSLAGIGNKRSTGRRATFLGLMAGIGALYLPKQMGLSEEHTTRTTQTELQTMGLYTFGGLVAGTIMKLLNKKSRKKKRLELLKGRKYQKIN